MIEASLSKPAGEGQARLIWKQSNLYRRLDLKRERTGGKRRGREQDNTQVSSRLFAARKGFFGGRDIIASSGKTLYVFYLKRKKV